MINSEIPVEFQNNKIHTVWSDAIFQNKILSYNLVPFKNESSTFAVTLSLRFLDFVKKFLFFSLLLCWALLIQVSIDLSILSRDAFGPVFRVIFKNISFVIYEYSKLTWMSSEEKKIWITWSRSYNEPHQSECKGFSFMNWIAVSRLSRNKCTHTHWKLRSVMQRDAGCSKVKAGKRMRGIHGHSQPGDWMR